MTSKAKTVAEYLDGLPEDRRAAISAVRDVILKNLGPGYEEGITYGMLGYYIPHSLFPAGYHCDPRQPLPFANLASQKNYMSLYLMPLYSGGDASVPAAALESTFRSKWAKTGKKLDMGKACIRFRKIDDLALDIIGETIAGIPAEKWIATMEALAERRAPARKTAAQKTATNKVATKKAAKR
jgi:hypothetical protein